MNEIDERVSLVKTMIEQIGTMNLYAISGGKIGVFGDQDKIELPCGAGYRVEVEYIPGRDTYTVRRILKRGGKRINKGEMEGVYCDEVGEVAYRASCFRTNSFGEMVGA